MALGTNQPRTYLSVNDGKIVQRATADTPGAVSRVNKNNDTVYESQYSFVSGVLTGIRIKKSEWQGNEIKSWVLDLIDGNDHYSLEIQYDSSWATSLLNALANPEVDFNLPIKLTPWQKQKPDGKYTRCLYVNQNESKDSIKWMFTKDEPNGLPPLVEVIFKGKKSWDNFDRMQFLEKLVEEHIVPQLPSPTMVGLKNEAVQPTYTGTDPNGPFKGAEIPTIETAEYTEEEDDLPF